MRKLQSKEKSFIPLLILQLFGFFLVKIKGSMCHRLNRGVQRKSVIVYTVFSFFGPLILLLKLYHTYKILFFSDYKTVLPLYHVSSQTCEVGGDENSQFAVERLVHLQNCLKLLVTKKKQENSSSCLVTSSPKHFPSYLIKTTLACNNGPNFPHHQL